jgi:predicted ATPase
MDKISITNFRKVKDTWNLDLAPITLFTGTNNSGKSSVIKALLLLEDYVKSDNHFELSFNGNNYHKHKIDCYSNAINWFNKDDNNLDIIFEYKNNSFDIKLIFEPTDFEGGVISKGRLKMLKVVREDNASMVVEHQGGEEYLMKVHNGLIVSKGNENNEKELINILNLTDNTNRVLAEKQKAINFELTKKNELEKELIKLEESFNRNSEIRRGASARVLDFKNKERFHILKNQINEINYKIIPLNQEISDINKKLVDLKKLANQFKSNEIKSLHDFMPEFSLNDFDFSERTIETIIRRVLSKYFTDDEKKLGNIDFKKDLGNVMYLADVITNAIQFNLEYLSPQRNSQTRLYINDNNSNDINNLINIHSHNPIINGSSASKFIKSWMKEFEIGEDFKIKQIEGIASKVEIRESGKWINLVDKGFGAGQIFSIILRIALCINSNEFLKSKLSSSNRRKLNNLIIIEEPEANLHPAFQSKLANLFLKTYNEYRIRFIIETHSEYIIRHSQVLIKEYFQNFDNFDNKTIRLNKVLRELNISLDRAVEHLSSKGFEIEARPTTIISNNEYEILLDGFQTDRSKRAASKEVNEEKRKEKEILRIAFEEIVEKHRINEEAKKVIIKAKAKGLEIKSVGKIEIGSKNLPFSVYYFEKEAQPYDMEYDIEGKFKNEFGIGFFDVSRKLTRKLM